MSKHYSNNGEEQILMNREQPFTMRITVEIDSYGSPNHARALKNEIKHILETKLKQQINVIHTVIDVKQ